MSFEDLPENWRDLPLDTPGLAADVTDLDRRWHQVVIDGCRDGGAPLLGAFLATPGNVRAFPAPLLATGTDGG